MIIVAICFYIIGLTIFYTWGQVNNGWQEWYYFWDKGKDLFLFIGIHSIVAQKHKWVVVPVIIFSSIRLLWQIISSFTGANINNVRIIGWLFIVLAVVSSFLTLKEVLKWRKLK